MLRLYDNDASRNGYKVVLLLTQLGVPFERIELDIFKGASRTPEFLAKNPAGKIPVLELEDGTVLAESCAILCYLAEGTPFMPDDRVRRAEVLRWMFFEQNAHETSVAEARFILGHPELSEGREGAILAEKQKRGNAALALMEQHLGTHDFFAAGRYTIADIALYGYTHVAGEGGFDMSQYPATQAWCARVAGQPGHVTAAEG
jgi:glutathione S-transferase